MKFIKFIKPEHGKQQYHYQCTTCNKTKVLPQKTISKTDLCYQCYLKSNEAKILNPRNNRVTKHLEKSLTNHIIYTVICDCCGTSFKTQMHNGTTCTSCGKFKRPLEEDKSSKYIGVCYIQPREGKSQGYWISTARFKGKSWRFQTYRDSEPLSNEDKDTLCAIHRDIGLRNNQLPNTRNFTDDKLSELLMFYASKNLI